MTGHWSNKTRAASKKWIRYLLTEASRDWQRGSAGGLDIALQKLPIVRMYCV